MNANTNNKKALFFDIDGTIFDGKTRSVLPSTLKALDILKEKEDTDIYLSTGRSFETLGMIKNYIKYFSGLNLSNGQEIVINNKFNYGKFFDKDVLKEFLDESVKMNTPLGIILKDEIVMNFITEESTKCFTTYIKSDVRNLDFEPFDLSQDVIQIWLFATNEEIDILKSKFPSLSFLNWGSYGADVVPFGSSKARGIKHIKELMGYKLENMYAFGDGDNDIEMFKCVGTSVAMGNACLKAKENATFITDDISDDGLYNALKKLNLI